MSEQSIENDIKEYLTGDARRNAQDFVALLCVNKMKFERAKDGYWADERYWLIKYKDEYVCFIMVNGSEYENEPEGWIVWSDDSDSDWYADAPLDEHMKEIAWKNVDICGNCSSCAGGIRKTIFSKEFEHVCRTTMRFDNPDSETVECLKKLMELRKNDISKRFI